MKKLFLILAIIPTLCLLLASCNNGDTTDDTVDTTATDTATETETAAPRYDYMAADVASDVEIGEADYKGVTLTIPNSHKITMEDVKTYIMTQVLFKSRSATNGTAMVRDQALKLGDDAYIYYKGFVDGKEFEGGSNWDDKAPYTLGLGSGSFIPGFEDALVGVIPNKTSKSSPAEIHVTFPEDYAEHLAGKEAVFHVVVEYAVQYTLPEYNRKFIEEDLKYEPKQESYASDDELIAEFEEFVYDSLVAQNVSTIEAAKADALWNHLLEKAVCKNLPADEVAYYFDVYKSEANYYHAYYTSSGNAEFTALYPDLPSFIIAYFGFEKGADWEVELTKMAETMVKQDMITHAIAEREAMETVTEEEYKAEIKYWVDQYYGYMTESQIVENMGERSLREAALVAKMDKWLLEQVTFTYADGSPIVSNTNNEAETETAEG
ncbi:MAG: FKBP-type peptidyl-prolyl cis-trans isomerase [Clostridia bacterium]|nr:FKBP-type peptidyl-prolyl cis-trans isomerase [Clostridia bacterium]